MKLNQLLVEQSQGYYAAVMIAPLQGKPFVITSDLGPFPTAQAALDRAVLVANKYDWISHFSRADECTPAMQVNFALDPQQRHVVNDESDGQDESGSDRDEVFDNREFTQDGDHVSVNRPDHSDGKLSIFTLGSFYDGNNSANAYVKDGPIGPSDFSQGFSNFMSKVTGNAETR